MDFSLMPTQPAHTKMYSPEDSRQAALLFKTLSFRLTWILDVLGFGPVA